MFEQIRPTLEIYTTKLMLLTDARLSQLILLRVEESLGHDSDSPHLQGYSSDVMRRYDDIGSHTANHPHSESLDAVGC